MTIEIETNGATWICPKCGKQRLARDGTKEVRTARCCREKFEVFTELRERIVQDTVIIKVEMLKTRHICRKI